MPGNHGKRRKTRPALPFPAGMPMQGMMPLQFPGMQMPIMPMQGMMPFQNEQESASDPDSDMDDHKKKKKYNKGDDGKISKATTKVALVPSCRLAECLEKLDNRLDVTFTADLSQTSLLQFVWLLTRVKPQRFFQ